MDANIISRAIEPDILELLHQGKFDAVHTQIEKKLKWSIWNFFKKSKAKANFAYRILQSCLNKSIKPSEYSRISRLDFKGDCLSEIMELHRILLVIEDYAKAPEIERLVSLTLLECIRDGAIYIENNVKDHPQHGISAKIWIAGSSLRLRADELAGYFMDKRDEQSTLEAVFLIAKLTNSIMSHYPDLVASDMVRVALQLEKMGNKEKAKPFFNAVALDFPSLLDAIEEEALNNSQVTEDDYLVTKSLIQALEGLKRLGENIDEETLKKAISILELLKKADENNEYR